MCIAAPFLIEEINPDRITARAVFLGNTVNVDIRLVEAKAGDYVLVHAGCAIEVVREEEALEMQTLFAELEELGHDGA